MGVEKITISSIAIENPSIISQMAEKVGNQSVVVVMNVKKKLFGGKYELFTHIGKKSTGIDPVFYAKKMQDLGAGEIVINSIDNNGVMTGYDLTLIEKIRNQISIPLTVSGGDVTLDDICSTIQQHVIIGVSACSFSVFKGKYKNLLINHPTPTEKEALIKKYFLEKWA